MTRAHCISSSLNLLSGNFDTYLNIYIIGCDQEEGITASDTFDRLANCVETLVLESNSDHAHSLSSVSFSCFGPNLLQCDTFEGCILLPDCDNKAIKVMVSHFPTFYHEYEDDDEHQHAPSKPPHPHLILFFHPALWCYDSWEETFDMLIADCAEECHWVFTFYSFQGDSSLSLLFFVVFDDSC